MAVMCCLLLSACGFASQPAPSVSPAGKVPSPTPQSPPSFARGSVAIQTKTGIVTLSIEIADTEAKREYGLMNRTLLAPAAGMLFIFQPPADARQIGFWMKDTLIPLSLAFVEPDMTIESLQEMEPMSEQLHMAPRDYAYAIEANKGFFVAHAVSTGDRVVVRR